MWTTNVIYIIFHAKFSRVLPYFGLYLRFLVFFKGAIGCAWWVHILLNHCPLFKGCLFHILVGLSLLYHLYRPLRDYMKIGDLAKIPLSNPQMKQISFRNVHFFSIYFICGLIIDYSQIWWYDIFRYMQDMRKSFFFPVHKLVLCLGFIGFFIEPRLCAIFLSIGHFWQICANLPRKAIHNRPIMANFGPSCPDIF